jgi:hypothetical protein
MSYIILTGHWCDIVLNVHAPTEDKTNDTKDSFYKELEHLFYKFPKYHKKVLFRDVNAKVGREYNFKPTIGNESVHGINDDNGVRVVSFATSKNLIVKSTVFPHCNIHKFPWTSPDGKDTQSAILYFSAIIYYRFQSTQFMSKLKIFIQVFAL